jgi:hypothetical protein
MVMRTFKEEIRKVLSDVSCDICGKSTTNNINIGPDYATLESCWGYGSKNDGTKYNIELCETCFFEVLNFIKDKRRKVLGPFNYPYNKDPLEGIEYL